MHRAGLTHADVKGDNIFIEQQGRWFLGDFGSCKKVGDIMTSSTAGFYSRQLVGAGATGAGPVHAGLGAAHGVLYATEEMEVALFRPRAPLAHS
jgi:serine/threonine protein kinase